MNAPEGLLLAKIKTLSPQHGAEVEDFVDFLTAKGKRDAAFDRLLAMVPALESAGMEPMTEHAIASEVMAARSEPRARRQVSGQAGDEST